MNKKLKVKLILFIFLLFFVFNIKVSAAPWASCDAAGGECITNPSAFQYEIITTATPCPDADQKCAKKFSNCTDINSKYSCKLASACQQIVNGFCSGSGEACCKDNVIIEEKIVAQVKKQEPPCPTGQIHLEVPIPGLGNCVTDFSDYMVKLYNYLIYAAGVLAVIVIMIGGFQWISAGGNQSKIGEARERILGAIVGLVLAIGSYMILEIINPKLLEMELPNIPVVNTVDFDLDQYNRIRAEAIKANKTCNSNSDCSQLGFVCAPKSSTSPNEKICMNQSKDIDQCDEKIDCLQGLECDSNRCKVPDLLRCVGQSDLGARCFLGLYPIKPGLCRGGNTCLPCSESGGGCYIGTGFGLSLNLYVDNDSICKDANNVCGQISNLVLKEEFKNLPLSYQQAPRGDCLKNCGNTVFTLLNNVVSPVFDVCTYTCK